MRIKALINLVVSSNKEVLKGQEYDLNESDAKNLIERGFAEGVKVAPANNKPNPAPKPVNGGAKTVPPAERGDQEKGQSDDTPPDQGDK